MKVAIDKQCGVICVHDCGCGLIAGHEGDHVVFGLGDRVLCIFQEAGE